MVTVIQPNTELLSNTLTSLRLEYFETWGKMVNALNDHNLSILKDLISELDNVTIRLTRFEKLSKHYNVNLNNMNKC